MVRAEYLHAGSCRHPECMALAGGRLSSREFPSIVVHLEHPVHGHVLFDTGYSPRFFAATRPFPQRLYAWTTPVALSDGECALAQLARKGLGPEDIGTIVLSHFHGDHAAGLRDFPRSTIVCRKSAWKALGRPGFHAVRKGILHELVPRDLPRRARWIEDLRMISLPKELEAFAPGWDLFGDGSLRIVDLPGHAPGHVGLHFVDRDRGPTFLVGDACWLKESIDPLRPPHFLTRLVMHDHREAARTLESLARLRERDRHLLIVPSHCKSTLEPLLA